MQSNDDLQIFHLQDPLSPPTLLPYIKFDSLEFNRNMVVDEHPALIVASTNLCYDIIFGADFLDKCGITLDYNANQVCWMEHTIPLCDTVDFFVQLIFLSSHIT